MNVLPAMKRRIAIGLLGLLVPVARIEAQPRPPDPRPDLAISGIAASASQLGVDETFTYTVTARNAGSLPCNWVNLTLRVPGELNLVSASSPAPLTCAADTPIRIVGLPFEVACRGGPGFFLWPGSTISASFVMRTLRAAPNGVRATAVADPGNVCFEANESNNTATSAATAIILRPELRVTLNRPFPPTTGRNAAQVFPVTVANVGAGAAGNIAVQVSHSIVQPDFPYSGPEIVVAYKGTLLGPQAAPASPIAPDCSDMRGNGRIMRLCILPVTLRPGETLQIHFRSRATCTPPTSVPVTIPEIRFATADDLPQAEHAANLRAACGL